MICGLGMDVVPVARIADMLRRYPVRLEERLFTPGERADCAGRARPEEHYAARFAAKEATIKALGGPPGLRWHDMEIRRQPSGEPRLFLWGEAARLAQARGVVRLHVTLTHAGGIAAAVVVLEAAG